MAPKLNIANIERKAQLEGKSGKKPLSVLNVPCIAWVYSQNPDNIRGNAVKLDSLRSPILIYWLETSPPKHKLRKIYYASLDQVGAPISTNMSAEIRRLKEEFGDLGFTIDGTNTFRYVYPVPKINDRRPLVNNVSPGKNLQQDYETTSEIIPFIADQKRLVDQKIEDQKLIDTLVNNRDTENEQLLYRNLVVEACNQPSTLAPSQENKRVQASPTCQTNAFKHVLEGSEKLYDIATAFGWNIHIFLQYVADNTYKNFYEAGQGAQFVENTFRELASLRQLLLGSTNGNYGYSLAAAGAPFTLIFPKSGPELGGNQLLSGTTVFGMRAPYINLVDLDNGQRLEASVDRLQARLAQ